jgi:hypothetical protein
MDRRRLQDFPMLVEVSEYFFPVHDSSVSDCVNQPAQPRVRESRAFAWRNIVDRPTSPDIPNARMHCRELGHVPPHIHDHLVMGPLHLRYSRTTYLYTPYPSQQPTPLLTPNPT